MCRIGGIVGIVGICAGLAAGSAVPPAASQPSVAADITREALLPNAGPMGHPLPLAASWNTGLLPSGLTPAVQIALIESGHHLLPCLKMPDWKVSLGQRNLAYYRQSLLRAAQLGLPICLVSTQWENLLSYERRFWVQPLESNPNVIDLKGRLQQKVSPFGPVELWEQAGRMWTDGPSLRQLQELYPHPPLVLMLSNNEHPRLRYSEAETCQQYLDAYGRGRGDTFRADLFATEYAKRYRALQEGMRQGLTSPDWRSNARFVGYQAFSKQFNSDATVDPNPQTWDGGSFSLYLDTAIINDIMVNGVQARAAMLGHNSLEETYRLNPEFWLEISTWSGQIATVWTRLNPQAGYAATAGTFSPRRYAGLVQMNMWLMRPRVVREYRDGPDRLEDFGPYFMQVVSAVDRIWANPALEEFWRFGQPVANPNLDHPVRTATSFKATEFCLLDTSADPKGKVRGVPTLPVFATALSLDEGPQKRWLIYAHAPEGERSVTVTLPGFGPVDIQAPVEGGYYLVRQQDRQVERLTLVDLRQAAKALAFR